MYVNWFWILCFIIIFSFPLFWKHSIASHLDYAPNSYLYSIVVNVHDILGNVCMLVLGLPLTTIFISINLSTNLSINFPQKNFYLRIFIKPN